MDYSKADRGAILEAHKRRALYVDRREGGSNRPRVIKFSREGRTMFQFEPGGEWVDVTGHRGFDSRTMTFIQL
jgi:hypothetical protein